MKRIFILFLASVVTASSLFAEEMVNDVSRIKRFIGTAEISSKPLSERNTYYWSVGTEVSTSGMIKSARQTLSSGVGQADFRICTYEDGSPIFENGKYFINVSSRLAGVGQTIYSFDINTCMITLIGTMQGFYTDGSLRSMVAPHIIYNRKDGYWYVFAHWNNPHHLCVGKTVRDPRYGYSEITCDLLDYESISRGDEDNFVFYDDSIGKWVLVYSKGSSELFKQYSDRIDGNYKLVMKNETVKSLTGINVTRIGGKRYIFSGYGWSPEEDAYKVFDMESLSYLHDLNLDIPTGGFRGWGTVLDIIEGEDTKYQLLTFDRINPTFVDNWQYGNIYLYEAVERNRGLEYDVRRPDGNVIKAGVEGKYTPKDFHFVRKFSERFNYSQELVTARMDLSSYRIFLPKGNPYPVKDNSGSVSYIQNDEGVQVNGIGSLSLLGGIHLPTCEYVIDLDGIREDETRYLKIGTLDNDIVNIRFSVKDGVVTAYSWDKPLLSFSSAVNKVRVLVQGTQAHFINANQ